MVMPVDQRSFTSRTWTTSQGSCVKAVLWCDRERQQRNLACTNIGYTHIKLRRLTRAVDAGAGGTLGDYVPFNFCPRSVMLYVIHKGHRDYGGGQEHIVHLVSTVSRAVALERPWAFSDRHAELAHALHFDDLARLNEVNWAAMPRRSWESVREERQAEFLVKGFFPWSAVIEVAAMTRKAAQRASATLERAHVPPVAIRPEWYY
jgi:hypothetical protein